MKAKTYLLIDNSNTRTKFVLSTAESLEMESIIIPTREICRERLDLELSKLSFDQVVISSVVPRIAEQLLDWAPKPVHVLSCDSRLNVGIDYPKPRQVGADRLANAVGVVDAYGAPAIVVDFGTAVTFDVISASPSYIGGVIAPGLASMGDYLVRNTALLPAINPKEPDAAIGKSTEQALHAGSVFGYRGLVTEILMQVEKEMGCCPVVVATGGDAALIARGVARIDHVDPFITLNGLRIIAALNDDTLPRF